MPCTKYKVHIDSYTDCTIFLYFSFLFRCNNSVRRQSNAYQRMELDNGDGTTQVVYVDKETGVQVDRPPQHLKKVNMQKNT